MTHRQVIGNLCQQCGNTKRTAHMHNPDHCDQLELVLKV